MAQCGGGVRDPCEHWSRAKLTIDYGLRYDYQTYLKETGGRYAQFAPLVPNPTADGQPSVVEFERYGMNRNRSRAMQLPIRKKKLPSLSALASERFVKLIPRPWFAWVLYSAIDDANGVTSGGLSIPNPVATNSFGQPVMTLAQGIPPTILVPFPSWNVGQPEQAPPSQKKASRKKKPAPERNESVTFGASGTIPGILYVTGTMPTFRGVLFWSDN